MNRTLNKALFLIFKYYLSLFLWIGTTFAFFHSFGKDSFHGSKVRTKALILKKHKVLTCEWKFHHIHDSGFKDLIILVTNKDDIFSVVSKTKLLGRVLSFSIALHCWVKNSLNKFAFFQKVSHKLVFNQNCWY